MVIENRTSSLLKSRIKSGEEVFCRSLFFSARWFVLSQCADKGLHLILLPDKESAEYCATDLYNLIDPDKVFFLPDSGSGVERSNYKSTLNVQRTTAIQSILNYRQDELCVLVTFPEALDELIPATNSISGFQFEIHKGDEISHEKIIKILFDVGFERVDFVSAPGQFAVRGSIIDFFSYSNNEAYRLSFWGDEIEKIHIFDCNTQLSKSECSSAWIMSDILCSDSEGGQNILQILPRDSVIWFDSFDMYKDREFLNFTSSYANVYLEVPLSRANGVTPLLFHIQPQPVFNKNFELLCADIRSRLEQGYKVNIFCEKQSQADRIVSILEEELCPLPEFVIGKNIHKGFIDSEDKICCYSDHEIFERFHRAFLRRTVEKSEQLTVNDLASFNIGDYIVHIDHGIGVFGGLVRIKDDMGRFKEVVKLIYKDGDVVFVSVHGLHKISRYRSKDGEVPKVNKLGSKTWQTLKNNTKSKVKDIAKDLIQLYAKRRASKGFAFSADSYLQDELESSFMYEDTPDQEEATKAMKRDMEDTPPMDRLICGDVGFGKTEVAIRGAFKAATDGKQVAVLVPTTILALQHYKTFVGRLANLPCRVDYVSRLRSAKEISQIKKDLKEGRIDILIGTHKILSKEFEFKDLGLLIIDEEQKFGVSAKEKLRQLQSNIDTLTLTATPIPRTLQFSLMGARDLSIISTPPPNRIPVQTEIILFEEKEIKSILEYELKRGGQIFFLHNRVEQLPAIEDILHRLEPDMRICVAHGQMPPKVLEDKILSFMEGEYDLLLCTTIIENGLDIPNANTIIINQAQNFGLSDLHQLRGRVGRSNKKAFCYLIVPPLSSVTEDARKRLKAIEEFSDLGSGFNIAMQDLDIRGAGNLLGAEQSGFIMDMGYETYQKILAEAMEELGVEIGKSIPASRRKFASDCSIETDQQALIPDDYMDITAEKIRIYKQLDSFSDEREIDRLLSQLQDRFGDYPQQVENLFNVVKIRNLGQSLGFEKIIIKNGMLICFFIADSSSQYYTSDAFATLLNKINSSQFTLKQSEGRLKIITRGILSTGAALEALKKLQ
ncbi:MAG: transcription-repair coupling factor [Candidatus Cryptobacteroides sp.]